MGPGAAGGVGRAGVSGPEFQFGRREALEVTGSSGEGCRAARMSLTPLSCGLSCG